MFCFHPYLGKTSNLTNIFQLGWNHQPASFFVGYFNGPNGKSQASLPRSWKKKTPLKHDGPGRWGLPWNGAFKGLFSGALKLLNFQECIATCLPLLFFWGWFSQLHSCLGERPEKRGCTWLFRVFWGGWQILPRLCGDYFINHEKNLDPVILNNQNFSGKYPGLLGGHSPPKRSHRTGNIYRITWSWWIFMVSFCRQIYWVLWIRHGIQPRFDISSWKIEMQDLFAPRNVLEEMQLTNWSLNVLVTQRNFTFPWVFKSWRPLWRPKMGPHLPVGTICTGCVDFHRGRGGILPTPEVAKRQDTTQNFLMEQFLCNACRPMGAVLDVAPCK